MELCKRACGQFDGEEMTSAVFVRMVEACRKTIDPDGGAYDSDPAEARAVARHDALVYVTGEWLASGLCRS